MQSNPAGPHAVGLYESIGALPAAIALALKMNSPLWWLLPLAAIALVLVRLRLLYDIKRKTAQAPTASANSAR